jgi:hypothetical protein
MLSYTSACIYSSSLSTYFLTLVQCYNIETELLPSLDFSSTMKMEAVCLSKTSVNCYQTAQCYIPEFSALNYNVHTEICNYNLIIRYHNLLSALTDSNRQLMYKGFMDG